MRTIYIHIGRGKTGTTLIQSFLSQKREELLKQGIHYLHVSDYGTGCGHQDLAKTFIDNPPTYMVPAVLPEKTQQETRAEISNSTADVILISSENFAMAKIADVFEFFNSLPEKFNIKIIFFTRSQDEVAESEYNQFVKLKRETCTFKVYAHKKLEGCDYMEVASAWEHYFGYKNMICRIYDAGSNNILESFTSCIHGLRGELLSPYLLDKNINFANVSVGMQALTVMRLLNGLELEDRDKIYADIIQKLSNKDVPAVFFDSAQAREFRNLFAESNRSFNKRYIGCELDDLGGRRYSDQNRDRIRHLISELNLGRY